MAFAPNLTWLLNFLIGSLLVLGVFLANRWLLTILVILVLLIIIGKGISGESMRFLNIFICYVHFCFHWFLVIENWFFVSKIISLMCRLYFCALIARRLFLNWIKLLTNTHTLCLLHDGVSLEELFIFIDHLTFMISFHLPPLYWVYHTYVRFLRLWVPVPIREVSIIRLSALSLTAPSDPRGWDHLGEATRVLLHLTLKLILEEVLKEASISMHTLLVHVQDVLLDLRILVQKRGVFVAFLSHYLHLDLSVLLPRVIIRIWILIRQLNSFFTVRFLATIR